MDSHVPANTTPYESDLVASLTAIRFNEFMKIIGDVTRKANDLLTDLAGVRIVRAKKYDYDKDHELQALSAVRTIEKFNSRKLLPQLKKVANDYAIQVLGKKEYAPWLYVYTLIRGEFSEGWIPDNFYGKLVAPRINRELRSITHFKTFTNVVLRTRALPDIAYYIDGIFYSKDLAKVDLAFLRKVLGDCDYVFVKKDVSARGDGVIKLANSDVSEDTFRRVGNCVVQLPISQHDFFEEIISGSVATVRIITVKDINGNIALRASYLRLGRKDTAWVQSDNSLRVAIDRNGDLDRFGYTEDWRRWANHPDTNYSFYKKRIPRFVEAVEYCIGLHALVPHFVIIGWDITISNDDEIKLIEWNADCDIKFAEATTGPCFTDLNWEKFRAN